MFFYDGLKCPVCGRPLFPNEDIVACPQCGLPHHRRCWEQEGHCHLEGLHGTDQQWSREKAEAAAAEETESTQRRTAAVCPRCHTENPEYAEFCQRCGMPLQQKEWHSPADEKKETSGTFYEYTPFTCKQAPSYDPNDRIDQVPAGLLSAYVGQNSSYYIQRFRQLFATGTGGWNWAALFFGPYWYLYRRMYLYGILQLVITAVYSFLASVAFSRLGIDMTASTVPDVTTMTSAQKYCLLSIFLLSVMILAIRIIMAGVANRLYKQHCISRIQSVQERVPDISPSELAQAGGVSFSVALIGYMIFYVLTQIVAVFLT